VYIEHSQLVQYFAHSFTICQGLNTIASYEYQNKMLSYRRETALQGTLVLAESGRLELRDNILLIL